MNTSLFTTSSFSLLLALCSGAAGCAAETSDDALESSEIRSEAYSSLGLTAHEYRLARDYFNLKLQYARSTEFTSPRRYGGDRITSMESSSFSYDVLSVATWVVSADGSRATRLGHAVAGFFNAAREGVEGADVDAREEELREAVLAYPTDADGKAMLASVADLARVAHQTLNGTELTEMSTSEDLRGLDLTVTALRRFESALRSTPAPGPLARRPGSVVPGTEIARALQAERELGEGEGCNHLFFREQEENERCRDGVVNRVLMPARNTLFETVHDRIAK